MRLVAVVGQRLALLARTALAPGEVADRLDEGVLLVGQRSASARVLHWRAVLIRHADPVGDAAACAAIYAPYVRDTVISLEEVPPSPERDAAPDRAYLRRYPWLVAEEDGEVAGFAYACQHRERAAYRWASDVSVYVDPAHHRRGIGSALYTALFELLVRQGVLCGVRRRHAPERGERRPARVARLPAGRRLPADRLEVRGGGTSAGGSCSSSSRASGRPRSWGRRRASTIRDEVDEKWAICPLLITLTPSPAAAPASGTRPPPSAPGPPARAAPASRR